MKRVDRSAKRDVSYQIRRVLVIDLLGIDHLLAVLVDPLAIQVLHHRLARLHHQRQHLLQLAPGQGRRDLRPEVLPGRVLQAEQILHADAVLLLRAGKVPVREVVEVPDHDLLDDLGIAQQQAGLVEDVEAEVGRVPVDGRAMQDTEVPARGCLEEHGILEVAEDRTRSWQLLDTPSLPVIELVAGVEPEQHVNKSCEGRGEEETRHLEPRIGLR